VIDLSSWPIGPWACILCDLDRGAHGRREAAIPHPTADDNPKSSPGLLPSRHSPPPPPRRRRRCCTTAPRRFSARCADLLYRRTSFLPSYSITHEFAADEAYFAPQVIACRDGSGYFPRNRLNDGYCDCADGTDEPGICLELPWICPNFTGVRGSWVSCGDLLGFADAVRSSGNKLAGHWVSTYVPTTDLLVNVRS
jgi:hypothetical protein